MKWKNPYNIPNRWLVAIGAFILPIALLFLSGLAWLIEHELLLAWFMISGFLSILVFPVIKQFKPKQLSQVPTDTSPLNTWSETGHLAWKEVQKLGERVQHEEAYIESLENLWNLLQEVMETVADQFYPDSDNSIMEVPIPYLLKVVELMVIDLRGSFTEHLPGSHILTINDFLRGKRLASLGKELYDLYRVVSFGVNIPSALVREFRDLVSGKLVTASSHELKAWLIKSYIEKIGFYSIELYSGSIILDEKDFEEYSSKAAEKAIGHVQKRDQALQKEPLRILVLGQVNSGKSSLINALFGEMKALVDVVPQTSQIEPYLLEREGIERAIIFDTAGYQSVDHPFKPLKQAKEEIIKTDLILLCCSSITAARLADRQMLEDLRQFYKENKKMEVPPVIVVLTQIDRLRPIREWEPPYNVAHPTRTKEKLIRSSMEAVSQDLKIELSQIVPVNLKSPDLYNIDEGLIPAILGVFDETQRLKYLRCLRDYQEASYWEKLWEQSKNAGKLFFQGGIKKATQISKQMEQAAEDHIADRSDKK